MRRLRPLHLSFGIIAAAIFAFVPVEAAGPLRVSTQNPRYFTDDTGRAIYLTGSHTWTNFIDRGQGNPPPVFDYTGYLDFLASHGHNFIRLWNWEQSRWSVESAIDDYWYFPGPPWERTGPGAALDSLPKFDLTKLSQPWFDRLRQRCEAAQSRGIYVSIMLFDGWSVSSTKGGLSLQNPWHGHPMNANNNVNGIDGDTNGDDSGEEVHELGNSVVVQVEEAYVRKVIDTVDDLDNILYEICNECDGGATQWEYHMIDLIHTYEGTLGKRHPVGMTTEFPNGANEDLLSSTAEWISPQGDVNNPLVSDGTKVVVADTDHLCGICGDAGYPWRWFLRGENPLFMDEYDSSKWEPLRLNLGYTLQYANRIDLAGMAPSTLSNTGYCLAKTQRPAQYLVYDPGGGDFTLDLSASADTFAAEWFDPGDGSKHPGTDVVGGNTQTFTPPFGGDAVLYLSPAAAAPPETVFCQDPRVAKLSLPNPLHSSAVAKLCLPRSGSVSFTFFDVQGRKVFTTPEVSAPAGASDITIPFGPRRSGVYFWSFEFDHRVVDHGKAAVLH